MSKIKNILITPLDWGLGHATRCIPIIKSLEKEFNVFVGCSGNAAILLKKEFPHLKHLPFPSYNISYPVRRKMTWHMALQLPSIISAVTQEKKVAKQYIEKYDIDLIISDNRFGAYSKKIPSIFITHQVNIKSPALNKTINRLNHKFIGKFSACWIPDFENENNLAGELSHPSLPHITSKYIGPLTRFDPLKKNEKTDDLTVVLSGPEPQRTLFEDLLIKQLLTLDQLKINLVRGLYSTNEEGEVQNIKVYDHLPSEKLNEMIHQSKNIICRSGYSSIMDLQNVDAKILLIPTPQQTEQEYLANLHSGKNNYLMQTQEKLDIMEFLQAGNQEKKIQENSSFDYGKWIREHF